MAQSRHLGLLINALGENNSLKFFSVKLNLKTLNEDTENIVFADNCEELRQALETDLPKNTSITELELVNLRLNNQLIDYLGKGMRNNESITSLNISGTLMVNSNVSNRLGMDYQCY